LLLGRFRHFHSYVLGRSPLYRSFASRTAKMGDWGPQVTAFRSALADIADMDRPCCCGLHGIVP
jgi:hypothetical protein